jgi:hypothetical protein
VLQVARQGCYTFNYYRQEPDSIYSPLHYEYPANLFEGLQLKLMHNELLTSSSVTDNLDLRIFEENFMLLSISGFEMIGSNILKIRGLFNMVYYDQKFVFGFHVPKIVDQWENARRSNGLTHYVVINGGFQVTELGIKCPLPEYPLFGEWGTGQQMSTGHPGE